MVFRKSNFLERINVTAPNIYFERPVITHAPQPEDLLPISLATLPLTSTVGVNVYLKTRVGEPPLLFNAAHNPISRTQFEELMRKGSNKLFIHRKDRDLYQQAVQDCWQVLLQDQALPVQQRLAAVYEMTRDALSAEFANGKTESIIQTCQHYGRQCVAVLDVAPVSPADLLQILHRDGSLTTQAVNTLAFTSLLGRALGFSVSQLEHLATGALLHDLGMLEVDPVVVNKPGRLLDSERRQVQAHPGLGLQRVIQRTDLPVGVMMMIYQHHERLNGSGYPVGISDSEIHPWSRLCAIADVFAALTSARAHRQPIVPETALAVLDRGSGIQFDREMVTCWQRLVSN